MSEDLFANPHSQIPDELWKTPSPIERQLAAVEYWSELTHPEKTASSPVDGRTYARLKDLVLSPSFRVGAPAATTGTAGLLSSLYYGAKDDSGLSRSQREAANRLRNLEMEEAATGESRDLKRRLLEAQKAKSDFEAAHPILTPIISGLSGVAIGGMLGKMSYDKFPT